MGAVFDVLTDVLMCVYGCIQARFGRICGYSIAGVVSVSVVIRCGKRSGCEFRLRAVTCSAMRDDAFCNVWYHVSAMYGDTVRRNTLFVRSCNRITPENATV